MGTELLLKAVADSTRLKILSSLVERPRFVEELAKELNISESTVSFHLKKLQAVGLVVAEKEQYYRTYHVNRELLSVQLIDFIKENGRGGGDKFFQEVVGECFCGGRLTRLPVQLKKREAIYRELIKKFKRGQAYTDREINLALADVYDEFTLIKNELVAHGFLIKCAGGYTVAEEPPQKTLKKPRRKREDSP